MLRAYRHDDKSVAREWKIESLSLADLQQPFGVSRDDPMFGSFPVGEAQAGPLSHDTSADMALAEYAYFGEADAT